MNTQNNQIVIVETENEPSGSSSLSPLGESVGVRGNGASEPGSDSLPEASCVNLKPKIVNPPVTLSSRNGKIARLPLDIRENVNSMLRNNFRHATIVQKLAELGYPGISVNSISTWKHGGYIDWLLETQHQEKRLALPSALERCHAAVAGARLQQNAIVCAATALTEIMNQFDFSSAVALLRRRPELFPSFVHSIAALGRSSSELANAFGRFQ